MSTVILNNEVQSKRIYQGPGVTGANLKTATTLANQLNQIKDYIEAINKNDFPEGLFFIAPAMPILSKAAELLKEYPQIKLATQTIYPNNGKENTGNVLAAHDKELGIQYSMIGHMEERRNLRLLVGSCPDPRLAENNVMAQKIEQVTKAGIAPIICIGDTAEERMRTKSVLLNQFMGGTKLITKEDLQKLIDKGLIPAVAYEPAWAIGATAASPELVDETCKYIRSLITEKFGEEISAKMPILYGGSISPENVSKFTQKPSIDGVLVGGASYGTYKESPKIFAISRAAAADVKRLY
ncbi:MAG: triose-phosphate isomerase family protein [Candidatus Margulisiibacteriota bacterium]|jgi:triosephosphate isomerase